MSYEKKTPPKANMTMEKNTIFTILKMYISPLIKCWCSIVVISFLEVFEHPGFWIHFPGLEVESFVEGTTTS